MARAGVEGGFVPPPYPHDRLGELRAIAAAAPGGLIDASVGTPVDPTPQVALEAASTALGEATGYPATIGAPALREAAAAWIRRRFGVTVAADAVMACLGTKEVVAGLPRLLSLRNPDRDTVLYPALSYPTYAMGATLAGLRAVPVPVDEHWRPDVTAVDRDDVDRALLLWCNDPANPSGVSASRAELAATVEWARARDIVVASDECYAEFTYDDTGAPAAPITVLDRGNDGVLAVHSLSKRSNMAGFRVGFVAGDADLVRYLGEVRKHAGMMVSTPMQAAAAAALGDDSHVDEQRARYATRRARALPALEAFGLVHDGGPSAFYLWLRSAGEETDGWELAGRLARAGVLGAPGDLYGPAGASHVRLALTLTDDQVERLVQNVENVVESREAS
ncbi:MAG: succinyldiaminopimelate transaminase [Acidimicrobiia bacterium]